MSEKLFIEDTQGMGTKKACTREPQAVLDKGFRECDRNSKSYAGDFTKQQQTISNNQLLPAQSLTHAPEPVTPASCILV